jgi:hypothetical protein
VLDDARQWGFVDGNFLLEATDDLIGWMHSMANREGIDARYVSVFSFSAGAFAITEVISRNWCLRLHTAIVAGVHGHSQADLKDIPAWRQKKQSMVDMIRDKWTDY